MFKLPRWLLAGLFGATGPTAADELSRYLQPEQRIEVAAGRRLNLVCVGTGFPTVVFESGLAEPASTWFKVQPAIAERTRTCSYDRAGTGFSDAPAHAGSSAEAVADLRSLLAAAKVEPPYVLVGHSYGGMHARYFFYQHPAEVAGLVLVDPSHEDQTEGYRLLSPRGPTREQWRASNEASVRARRQCAREAERGFRPGSAAWQRCVFDPPAAMPPLLQRAYLQMQQSPGFHLAQANEEESVFGASVEQLRAARRSFRTLPVTVLTQAPDPKPLRDWETRPLREARTRMWANLHLSLADSSSRGVHRVVPGADHSIQLSQPGAVIAAIEAMLDTLRADADRLTAPAPAG